MATQYEFAEGTLMPKARAVGQACLRSCLLLICDPRPMMVRLAASQLLKMHTSPRKAQFLLLSALIIGAIVAAAIFSPIANGDHGQGV